jgi:hypothetical protein
LLGKQIILCKILVNQYNKVCTFLHFNNTAFLDKSILLAVTVEPTGTVIIQLVVTAVQAVTTVILLQLAVVTSLGILVVTAKYLQSVPVLLCMPLDKVTSILTRNTSTNCIFTLCCNDLKCKSTFKSSVYGRICFITIISDID